MFTICLERGIESKYNLLKGGVGYGTDAKRPIDEDNHADFTEQDQSTP
jgi:hypothetical protein